MKLLFLCTGNSCRSQMGEILLRRLRPDWCVLSAGVEAHGLNPRMQRVMAETGELPADLRSKTLEDLAAEGHPLASFDVVLTLCGDALDRCPVLPKAITHEHWGLPDPAKATGTEDAILNQFRAVRDDLHRRLAAFAASH
ncbi:MAG TPA: arsenate reductase ArsC [Holophagaceae bacterium]|nr:arsenate reductase ArsC [Holophagaceae bacterium]